MVPWAHPSAHPKRHIDWFSHFCRAAKHGWFNRVCQFAPVCAPPNTFPEANPSRQPKWHLDRFSNFCTAHGRVSSSMPGHVLSPKSCPLAWGDLDSDLVRGSLGPSESAAKRSLIRFSCFCMAAERGRFNRIRQVAPRNTCFLRPAPGISCRVCPRIYFRLKIAPFHAL